MKIIKKEGSLYIRREIEFRTEYIPVHPTSVNKFLDYLVANGYGNYYIKDFHDHLLNGCEVPDRYVKIEHHPLNTGDSNKIDYAFFVDHVRETPTPLSEEDKLKLMKALEEMSNQPFTILEPEESPSEWISVTEKLPKGKDKDDNDIYCLVYDSRHHSISVHPYNVYHNCWDTEDGDDYYTDAIGGKISHWMPLPAPPKQQEK